MASNCSRRVVAGVQPACVHGLAMLQAASMAVEDPTSTPTSHRFPLSALRTHNTAMSMATTTAARNATETTAQSMSPDVMDLQSVVPCPTEAAGVTSSRVNLNPVSIVTQQSPTATTRTHQQQQQQQEQQEQKREQTQEQRSSSASLCALLNPAPLGIQASLPSGFVLAKDGKIKKKRGRKPTPGLSDEDRRQARLLKNRRTAEVSRRRKLAQLQNLSDQRDRAHSLVNALRAANQLLTSRLSSVLNLTPHDMFKRDPQLSAALDLVESHSYPRPLDTDNQQDGQPSADLTPSVAEDHPMPVSDVSQPCSVADSDEDRPCSSSSPPTPCLSPRKSTTKPSSST